MMQTMLLRLLLFFFFFFSFSVVAALRSSSSGSTMGRTSSSPATATASSSSSSLKVSSIAEASEILSQWDAQFLGTTPHRVNSNTNGRLLRNSPQHQELYALLPEAVQYLNCVAAEQQKTISGAATSIAQQERQHHRCILGICAETAEEGVQALSSWVTALQLPRGLVFGLDHDGIPMATTDEQHENEKTTTTKKKQERGIYLKYNSSFAKPRRRKPHQSHPQRQAGTRSSTQNVVRDILWKTTNPPTRRRQRTTTSNTKDPDEEEPPQPPPRPQQRDYQPGDVLASPYSGKYRGVYFQIELQDRTFRQYLLPANIF